MITPDEILAFWFGRGPLVFRPIWFRRDPELDIACARFAAAAEAARHGEYDHWTETPRGTLALLLLLDQFPRNLHRNSPLAFATDAKAREVARGAVARGFDLALHPVERVFVYVPFLHSEALADQDESVRLFATLGNALGENHSERVERDREVIRRFGRYPHRNAVLGRVSTPEEIAYLAEPGART